nr:hypothetical protein [Tanacetum cinerariifolium]
AEAEAFLADVECTAPYEGQLAMTTTNMLQANHEDAYDSDIPASTFLDLNAQITSLYKVNEERNQTLKAKTQTIDTLTTELERYKLKVEQLDTNRMKRELEMALAERKKRSNELEEENIQLRTAIKGRDASLESVKSEKTNTISEKQSIEAKYVDEIILLTNANKVAA